MKRTLVLLAVVLASLPAMPRPAAAASSDQPLSLLPVETLIELLKPAAPVFEIVSPIVWPACSNAVLVNVLPGAVGVALPPEIAVVTGPLLVICGSVPQPATQSRKCGIDQQAQDLLAKVTTAVAGLALPVEIAPAKWITGQIDTIVDKVNLKAIPIGSTVAGVLQCVDPSTATTTTTAPTSDTTQPPATEVDDAFAGNVDLPTFDDLQTLPPVPVGDGLGAVTPIDDAPQVRFINQPKFRYPIVMGLPLVFIGLLVFFGRALTRPIDVKRGNR